MITDDGISWATMKVDSGLVQKLRAALWPAGLVKSSWAFSQALFADETSRFKGMLGLSSSVSPPSIPATSALTVMTGSMEPAQVAKASVDYENLPRLEKRKEDIKKHLARAQEVFKSTYRANARRIPNFPPRGAVLIWGPIELHSTSTFLVFEVKAWYDPKTKMFDQDSMVITLKRRVQKVQSPIGGA